MLPRRPRADNRDRSDRANKNPLTRNRKRRPVPRQLDMLLVARRLGKRPPSLAYGVYALPSEIEANEQEQTLPLAPHRPGKLTSVERLREWDRRQDPARKAYCAEHSRKRYARRKAALRAALEAFRAALPVPLPAALDDRLVQYRAAFPRALDAYQHPERYPADPPVPVEPPEARVARIKRERLARERAKREARSQRARTSG